MIKFMEKSNCFKRRSCFLSGFLENLFWNTNIHAAIRFRGFATQTILAGVSFRRTLHRFLRNKNYPCIWGASIFYLADSREKNPPCIGRCRGDFRLIRLRIYIFHIGEDQLQVIIVQMFVQKLLENIRGRNILAPFILPDHGGTG